MLVIWFLFDKSDEEYLSQIIKELSNCHNSFSFRPHITAHGIINIDIQKISKIIIDTVKEIKPFTIEIDKVSYSDDFWKTLFIDICPNKNIIEINKKLKNNLPLIEPYDFSPHISLMYKKINGNKKQEIAKTINVKKRFKISKLSLQKFSNNINEWDTIQEYPLN